MKDEKILKCAAIYSTLLMLSVITFSVGFQPGNEHISYASETTPQVTVRPSEESVFTKNENTAIQEPAEPTIYDVLPYPVDEDMIKELGENFIAIEKPEGLGVNYSFSLNESSVDRTIELTISHITDGMISEDQIHRFYEGNYTNGLPEMVVSDAVITDSEKGEELVEDEIAAAVEKTAIEGISTEDTVQEVTVKEEVISRTTDNVTSLTLIHSEPDEQNQINYRITMELIKTYAYTLHEDDNYFYVALKRPKDVYDKIVVLDAGHGGRDSGTYSEGEEYLEKDMNLDILLDLLEYLEQNEDIKVYVTRTTDRRLTLNQRVNLANDVEADFFLSIHCNANRSSAISGTEVLYNDKQNDMPGMNSKRFSQICLEEVTAVMGLKNRGLVARSHDVHIIGQSQVPVALVEVAFMSNRSDLEFLKKDSNKKIVAEGIYNAILRAYEELQ